MNLVCNIVYIKTYYDAVAMENIPHWYWILQVLSMIIPPVLLMIYWFKKTRKETQMKKLIAIAGLGLLHHLVFPVAAFFKTFPAIQGYETAKQTENEDEWRIRSLRSPTILVEQFIQVG